MPLFAFKMGAGTWSPMRQEWFLVQCDEIWKQVLCQSKAMFQNGWEHTPVVVGHRPMDHYGAGEVELTVFVGDMSHNTLMTFADQLWPSSKSSSYHPFAPT